jgi:hypothetical protein
MITLSEYENSKQRRFATFQPIRSAESDKNPFNAYRMGSD